MTEPESTDAADRGSSEEERRPGGTAAIAWSGGKDSALALHRARREGLEVGYLFTVIDRASGRVPFHGVRGELIEAQAEALGLESLRETAEEEGFEDAFLRALGGLRDAGVTTIVFGNIHLEDVRAWYEERTSEHGFDHVEPLWGGPPARLAREGVSLGYRAVVVSVNLESGDPEWLGRDVDPPFVEEVAGREGVDPCGERGEFHTFVFDGPLFRRPVGFDVGEWVEMEGHRLLDLTPA